MFEFTDPPSPQEDYAVTLCVRLPKPVHVDGSSDPVVGFFQVLGVRCSVDHLPNVIAHMGSDGHIVWENTDWRTVYIDRFVDLLDEEAQARVQPPSRAGVWYESARAFMSTLIAR
jgi:hypothetical protein